MARQAGSGAHERRNGRGRRAVDRYTEAAAALGRWIVDRQLKPIVLVDGELKALYVNRAARRLETQRGVLRLARRTKKVILRDEALQTELVARLTEAVENRSTVVRVSGRDADLEVSCLSLPGPAGNKAFVIALSEAPRGDAIESISLERRYGLTRAQAAVAVAFQRGITRAEIAVQREVSRATLKSHLAAVYRKLGVRTESAMVRKVAEVLQDKE